MFSIIYSKNPNKNWLKVLILFALILLILYIYKTFYKVSTTGVEGFEQNKRYILKRNGDIYDDFYIESYEMIYPPETWLESQLNTIIQMTQPSMQSSTFLDVGSKTGSVVDYLGDKGYRAYGVEPSDAMVNYSKKIYPSISVKCSDLNDKLLYERGLFSHILCLQMMIYSFKNKVDFFKNCHYWLKSGGYVVVHVVDKPRFNATIPKSIPYNPFNNWAPTFNLGNTIDAPSREKDSRNVKNTADYTAFIYDVEYEIPSQTTEVLVREKFTDKESGNIRANEKTIYMEEMGEIINDALFCNFIIHAKLSLSSINGGDPNQYLYVFEKNN